MMNDLFRMICVDTGELLLEYYSDELHLIEQKISRVPIWSKLSNKEKLEAIQYVVDNPNDEDFSHSGCCTPIHQATAYFLISYFNQTDICEDYFEDLDFM